MYFANRNPALGSIGALRRGLFGCRFLVFLCLSLLGLSGCKPAASTPVQFTQRAYVWQRDWTPDVSTAVREAGAVLDGLVVLGAQLNPGPAGLQSIHAKLDWSALESFGKPIGLAIRIEGKTLPPSEPVIVLARHLLQCARENHVTVSEFQIDFDSPERGLGDYRLWLPALRRALSPIPLRITALPAWLKQPEFRRLLREVDGFVLQVHSVPTREPGERVALFDPERATGWIRQAAELRQPFAVSLPTYTALVGYDPAGHFLGMALDGVQPAWPAGTRVAEFGAEAEELARFAATLSAHPAAHLRELFWYRLPVGSTQRNWRWSTFAAVLQGRPPVHRLEVRTSGESPVDLSLYNNGEAEERLELALAVRWQGAGPVAIEALPGWEVSRRQQEAVFTRSTGSVPRLLPGGQRVIGWLRFNQNTPLHAEILR